MENVELFKLSIEEKITIIDAIIQNRLAQSDGKYFEPCEQAIAILLDIGAEREKFKIEEPTRIYNEFAKLNMDDLYARLNEDFVKIAEKATPNDGLSYKVEPVPMNFCIHTVHKFKVTRYAEGVEDHSVQITIDPLRTAALLMKMEYNICAYFTQEIIYLGIEIAFLSIILGGEEDGIPHIRDLNRLMLATTGYIRKY